MESIHVGETVDVVFLLYAAIAAITLTVMDFKANAKQEWFLVIAGREAVGVSSPMLQEVITFDW